MLKYKEPIIAKITLRKKWVQAIEKIDSIEKRSRLLMIIFDGFVRGERYTSCNDPVFAPVLRMIYADLDESARRAAAARERREKRRQMHANPPRRSPQHIYEEIPAMYLFDGYASFMMSNGAGDARAYIKSKVGDINLDALIVAFRKFATKHKLLNSLHRFHVFRDRLLKFAQNFRQKAV